VNLIGEHTDYNAGFVFPVAIDRAAYVAARAREDRTVRVFAVRFGEEDVFSLDHIERNPTRNWVNYVRGIVKALLARDLPITGADLLIDGDVPLGSGLSSSAALEVATGYAFQLLNNVNLLGEELALLAQGVENNFVGVQSGIMDQFISALGRANHALLIDCRDLSYRPVPIPESVRVVVCDSRMARTLAASAYNTRRAECEEAVRLLKGHKPKITALRDVSSADLAQFGQSLPPVVLQRARHVVSENERAVTGAEALERGDVALFGRLMNASHASLRDDYEVSIPELDILVTAAQAVPGCYGSRLTGAGFGGCTVSLVDAGAVESFVASVEDTYREATGKDALIYVCKASDGVGRAG
jgi:galactokinase